MSGHTPGPWTFGVRSDGSIWQSRGNPLEGAHYQDDFFGTVEDAYLIAAAPEMLEALQAAMHEMPVTSSAYQDALAAITKATGGQPCLKD